MKKIKKIALRFCLVIGIVIPLAAVAHYVVFPQETRSILIQFSSFKKEGNIYFDAATPHTKIDSLKKLITQANLRVGAFWSQPISEPTFIFCTTDGDFKKYSSSPFAPAVTYVKLGATIVLSADALDEDIIAHEISHAALYEHIGFFKFNFGIPSWFKHGLAMQNDYRNYYSVDTLKVKTDNFKTLPNIKTLTTDNDFYAGTHEQVMLHYMAAKHEIKNWYTKEKLQQFISAIRDGQSFETAYNQ